MSSFCCIKNEELINNKNYPHSFYYNEIDDQNHLSQKKNEKEKRPSNEIKLRYLSSTMEEKSGNSMPISSKDVIIRKEGNPINDYKVISKLGYGTYGHVYKVMNKYNNDLRSMKQISKYILKNKNENEVMKEIEILKKLNHPYIIKLYEYYVADDYIYLINELSEEGDLQHKLIKIGMFPEFIVKIIMLQIFKALIYLNEKSIIHGDLKLENILVISYRNNDTENNDNNNKKEDGFINAIKHDMKILNDNLNTIKKIDTVNRKEQDFINELNKRLKENHEKEEIKSYGTNFRTNLRFRGKKPLKSKNDIEIAENKNIYNNEKFEIYNYGIKLIDFGCSKIFTRTKKNFNDIIGTLVYCAPEVLANNYNESCDIWSCGVIMYYLLSGHFPFMGDDEDETIQKIFSGKFEFDIENFNHISESAKDLIIRCLKTEPSKRISVKEALNHKFFDDLQEAIFFTEDDKMRLNKLKTINKGTKFYQLVLTFLSYNFSDNKLLNELNRLYDKLDRNSDYKITKAELFKAYKEANIPITQEELDEIISTMDFDMNGDIDYEEFIRMCLPKEKLFTEANLEKAFYMFDTNKEGFISPQKIVNFIEQKRNISEELKNKIKNEISDVIDGNIDCDKFKSIMMNLSK